MSASITHSIGRTEVTPIKGAKRSRFSWRFNTPRVRRWLLVQLVSIPVEGAEEEPLAVANSNLTPEAIRPDALLRLVDDYQTGMLMRRCA